MAGGQTSIRGVIGHTAYLHLPSFPGSTYLNHLALSYTSKTLHLWFYPLRCECVPLLLIVTMVMKKTIMMMTVMAMVMMTRWWVLPCVHITLASSSSGQTVSHHLSLHLDRMIIIMITIMLQRIMIRMIMMIKIY